MFLQTSKFFVYISVLSVLVVMTSTFFPFIGGKYYFFRAAIQLAFIFLLLHWALEARAGEMLQRFKRIESNPLFIAVSLFVLAFLLATIFAHDPNAAFWSNFERGEGGFQMLHYYGFFVLLALLFEKKDWERLFLVSLGAAILMILYGVCANLGWVNFFISPYQGGTWPEGVWRRLTDARFQGSLGNPAYVAPYLLFSIFYAVYFWSAKKIKNAWTTGTLFGVLIAIFLFFFSLSQTRGAFFGLVAAVFAFLVYIGFTKRQYRLPTLIITGLLIATGGILVHFRHVIWSFPGGRFFNLEVPDSLLFAAGIGALALAIILEFLSEKKYRPWLLGALAVLVIGGGIYSQKALSQFSEQTLNTRMWTWGSALNAFKERPIFGWGPENFSAAFDKYFDTRHFVPGQNTETWFDRAHSVILDYAATTGIVGILAYLGMFVILFRQMWKTFSKEHRAERKFGDIVLRAAVLALPIGYLIQGAALFDVLPIYINLFLFLAFALFYLREKESHHAVHGGSGHSSQASHAHHPHPHA